MGVYAVKKEIGPDTVLQRKQDVLFNEVDGEVVMLSIENGEYYGMDKVAARIWNLLERPQSLKNLISALKHSYDVSDEKCINDTVSFLIKLNERKLITIQ